MSNVDREHLRRVAYGPGATPQERAVAEETLRQRDAEELAADSAVRQQALDVTEPSRDAGDDKTDFFLATSSEESGDADADADAEQSLWQRRIRVSWLIPIVIVSLLVGVAGAFAAKSSPSESLATTSPVAADLIKGDLRAADSWFDRPFTEADGMPWILLDRAGVGAQDTRHSGISGAWVGRTDTSLCVLAFSEWLISGSNCVGRAKFAETGVSLVSGDIVFHWFGYEVTMEPSAAGTAGASAAPVTPQPMREASQLTSGPGNVEAANALFSLVWAAGNNFPNTEMLTDLGVNNGQVRLLGVNDTAATLWAVKRGSDGYCLVVFNPRATVSGYHCETTEEFRASGINVDALGISARWDGDAMYMSD